MSLLRYSIFNSLLLLTVASICYFYNAIPWLWSIDPTKVSFLIFGIYILLTAYLGIARERASIGLIRFVSERLTSLGLIGTIIGMMMLLGTVGAINVANSSDVVRPLFIGMSTVLITTFAGMVCSVLADFQLRFVFGSYVE